MRRLRTLKRVKNPLAELSKWRGLRELGRREPVVDASARRRCPSTPRSSRTTSCSARPPSVRPLALHVDANLIPNGQVSAMVESRRLRRYFRYLIPRVAWCSALVCSSPLLVPRLQSCHVTVGLRRLVVPASSHASLVPLTTWAAPLPREPRGLPPRPHLKAGGDRAERCQTLRTLV